MRKSGKMPPTVTWEEFAGTAEKADGSLREPRLFRAFVALVREDGSLEVAGKGSGDRRLRCEVLEGAEAGSGGLTVGDEVLVLSPGPGEQRGCVVGRIRHAARGSDKRRSMPDQIVLEAGKELVIRCGEGSLTIRADGKILIKGLDLVSSARRMNRIKGGAVSIN